MLETLGCIVTQLYYMITKMNSEITQASVEDEDVKLRQMVLNTAVVQRIFEQFCDLIETVTDIVTIEYSWENQLRYYSREKRDFDT